MTNDLISREKVLKLASPFTQYDEGGWGMDVRAVTVEDIESIPAVDAAPVVHGRWIEHVHVDEYGDCIYIDYECSACHEVEHFEDDGNRAYCPNCGARMDKEKTDV